MSMTKKDYEVIAGVLGRFLAQIEKRKMEARNAGSALVAVPLSLTPHDAVIAQTALEYFGYNLMSALFEANPKFDREKFEMYAHATRLVNLPPRPWFCVRCGKQGSEQDYLSHIQDEGACPGKFSPLNLDNE